MRSFLYLMVFSCFAAGVFLTALLRLLPVRLIANKVGVRLRAGGVYPDIDHDYLNIFGRLLSLFRYLAFGLGFLALAVGLLCELG